MGGLSHHRARAKFRSHRIQLHMMENKKLHTQKCTREEIKEETQNLWYGFFIRGDQCGLAHWNEKKCCNESPWAMAGNFDWFDNRFLCALIESVLNVVDFFGSLHALDLCTLLKLSLDPLKFLSTDSRRSRIFELIFQLTSFELTVCMSQWHT